MKNNYRIANNFWSRIRGRLGESSPSQPLLITKCKAVHTIGMKFPLRLTWLDRSGKIIKQEIALPGKFFACAGADSVLESHLLEITKDESGQALVEAALTIPVLLVIIFGFIQIGLAVHQSQNLTYVTHYATQVGAITNDENKISGALEEFLEVSDFTLSLQSRDQDGSIIPDSNRQHNDILTVQVKHPFKLQIPFVSLSTINLKAQASARVLCSNSTFPYTCNS